MKCECYFFIHFYIFLIFLPNTEVVELLLNSGWISERLYWAVCILDAEAGANESFHFLRKREWLNIRNEKKCIRSVERLTFWIKLKKLKDLHRELTVSYISQQLLLNLIGLKYHSTICCSLAISFYLWSVAASCHISFLLLLASPLQVCAIFFLGFGSSNFSYYSHEYFLIISLTVLLSHLLTIITFLLNRIEKLKRGFGMHVPEEFR
jgi:cellulose synthase/poly-beta-1,6-N-acetylglucosamine synthase-like glycosyltransferase